jgi:hypothetical protein
MSAKSFFKKVAKSQRLFNVYVWTVVFTSLILTCFSLSVRVFCSILLAAITPMAIFGLPVCFSAIKESLLEIRNKKNKRSVP